MLSIKPLFYLDHIFLCCIKTRRNVSKLIYCCCCCCSTFAISMGRKRRSRLCRFLCVASAALQLNWEKKSRKKIIWEVEVCLKIVFLCVVHLPQFTFGLLCAMWQIKCKYRGFRLIGIRIKGIEIGKPFTT